MRSVRRASIRACGVAETDLTSGAIGTTEDPCRAAFAADVAVLGWWRRFWHHLCCSLLLVCCCYRHLVVVGRCWPVGRDGVGDGSKTA